MDSPKKPGRSHPHLDVQLQGHRAHVGVEVEGGGGAAAQPMCHVLGVGQRRAQRHNADRPLNLRRDVAHARADHLQHGLWGNGIENGIGICEQITSRMGCGGKQDWEWDWDEIQPGEPMEIAPELLEG